MIQRWPSPIFYFIIIVVVMQSETRSRHASWKSYVSALDFILLIFFFFFFSLLFFLHFTCCNFISFEDKSFHYGSRCFVTFVLVPYIYSYGYYSLWELSEDPRYRFVIFIADVYQGVCLEQSTNCEKNIWKFFWIVVSSYSFWIS